MLNRFTRKGNARSRNLTVSVGLCLFSGTVAALTLAIIFSNWMIFREVSLYLPSAILAALLALVLRFPRAAGFPLFLIGGAFVVWMGYACLRFPAIDSSGQAQLARDRNGLIHVKLPPAEAGPDSSLSLGSSAEFLEFRAYHCSMAKGFPLFGGLDRGLIAEILRDGEAVYKDARVDLQSTQGLHFAPVGNRGFAKIMGSFFSITEASGRLDTKKLAPGMGLSVLVEGSALAFR
jgi:hypothetical protein